LRLIVAELEAALMNLQDYLKIKQAAEFLGVSTTTLRNWERSGKLIAYRHPLNGYRLYHRSDLEDVLRSIAKPGASKQ
jgi:MerR family transcriptional regulator, copper efflux regulator